MMKHLQFSALGHALRLSAFRLAIQHSPEGICAGEIAQQLGVAPSTLSSHLKHLQVAGLVRCRRDQQRRLYVVETAQVRELVTFLVQDCCDGQPQLCGMRMR